MKTVKLIWIHAPKFYLIFDCEDYLKIKNFQKSREFCIVPILVLEAADEIA